MIVRLQERLRPGLWQSLALLTAVTGAYALDYLFNLAAGRLLSPAEFSILISLTGIGQIMVVGSRVIQTVVTRYIARLQPLPDGAGRSLAFYRAMFAGSWRWGAGAVLVMGGVSIPLARFLNIPDVRVVWALALTTLLFIVRPVVGGVMQGIQTFAALGAVQLTQAVVRLAGGVLLMTAGAGVLGAMFSLPIASGAALLIGWWLLDRAMPDKIAVPHQIQFPELFRYSAVTAVGLVSFAVLINMDAILVRRFFSPELAGNYSAAITLGKVIQFFPVAVIMILFPKAARRQAARRDAANVLLPALGLVGVVCGSIALAYALFPKLIVGLTLGPAYQVDGRLLGLVGTGMLFLSLANVWLNYFLSTEMTGFVPLMAVGILIQAGMMAAFHDELWQLPAAMAVNGFWLTMAGTIIFLYRRFNSTVANGRS